MSVTGPLDSPRLDGTVALSLGEIRLADPQVVATDLTAQAVLSGTTASITMLTGIVNGGTLDRDWRRALRSRHVAVGTPHRHHHRHGARVSEGLRSALNADLAIALAQERGRCGPAA